LAGASDLYNRRIAIKIDVNCQRAIFSKEDPAVNRHLLKPTIDLNLDHHPK
jgi:hypothetical protein